MAMTPDEMQAELRSIKATMRETGALIRHFAPGTCGEPRCCACAAILGERIADLLDEEEREEAERIAGDDADDRAAKNP